MKFTHLHTHSHYSLLDGLAKIDDLVNHAQSLGMDSLALTDHGSMYGVVEFFQKAKKAGLKPLIGNEMYLAPNGMHNKRPNIDGKRHHLVLIAKNKEGYQNLVKLTTESYLKGFYYKPRIDKELLKKYNKGLIALSACIAGEVPRLVINGKMEAAQEAALEYQEIFGKGNFFLEIQHHPNIPEQAQANKGVIEIAKRNSIPLIATNDIHYLKAEDAEAQDVLISIQTDKKIQDENRLSMKDEDFSMRSIEKMAEDFKENIEAIENTQQIAELCNFEFELGNIKLPHYEMPNNKNADDYLEELCKEGLKTKQFSSPLDKVIKQLEYELGVIKDMGFASYFLIVRDFVLWAKTNGIVVGPGRGSAAGSVASYLLDITTVDPLEYNLLFERFLNPERISMPDIDLDFADARRDEVLEYVKEKYGQDHVAQIITFGTMAARAAIRDVGRALDYPYALCDSLAKLIPFGSNLKKALEEIHEFQQLYNTNTDAKKIIDMAMKLEGVVRHASTHACAVVISKDSLNTLVPRQFSSRDDEGTVTQYEMHAIDALGLLKMDFLGLKTLTIIQNTLNELQRNSNIEIEWDNIPLNDQKTFDIFREGKTTCIFQFESSGMKRYLKELKPSIINDIIAMAALYRPGPLQHVPTYIARKNGKERVTYLDPKLEPILKETYGVLIYQEQLMQMARTMAGFSIGEADMLRKAVAKKIKSLLKEMREKFEKGCEDNKVTPELTQKLWALIEPFDAYGFPKAHTVCYTIIAYRTAYLKAYYPAEFMASNMTSDENDIERIALLIDECKQMNIEVLPPDINESNEHFAKSGDMRIRFGLKAIKNVGDNISKIIVSERKKNGNYGSLTDFIERVQTKDLNKKSLEALIKCGAMDAFGERNQMLCGIEQLLNYAREMQKQSQSGQESLFGGSTKIMAAPALKLPEVDPAPKKETLGWEKELLGLYVSEHPLQSYKETFKTACDCNKLCKEQAGQRVKVGGIVSRVKKILTKKGDPMAFVQIEDLTGRVETLIFPKIFSQTSDCWQEDKIVMLSGKVSTRDDDIKILCDQVRVID